MGLHIIHVASQLLLTAVTLNYLTLSAPYTTPAQLPQQTWNIGFEDGSYTICNDNFKTCLGVIGDNVEDQLQVGLYSKDIGIGFLKWNLKEYGSTVITVQNTNYGMDLIDNSTLFWVAEVDQSDNNPNATNLFEILYSM